MPQEEASTFHFFLCLIWKPSDSNFWAKICVALEESIFQVEWPIATLIYIRLKVTLFCLEKTTVGLIVVLNE